MRGRLSRIPGTRASSHAAHPAAVAETLEAPTELDRLNVYRCDTCGGHIVTVDIHEGVTPAFLACRVQGEPGPANTCTGRMASTWYVVPPELADEAPGWEWFRPASTRGMSAEMREHVERGGLELRRREAPADA